jgi:hypothetical protein
MMAVYSEDLSNKGGISRGETTVSRGRLRGWVWPGDDRVGGDVVEENQKPELLWAEPVKISNVVPEVKKKCRQSSGRRRTGLPECPGGASQED